MESLKVADLFELKAQVSKRIPTDLLKTKERKKRHNRFVFLNWGMVRCLHAKSGDIRHHWSFSISINKEKSFTDPNSDGLGEQRSRGIGSD